MDEQIICLDSPTDFMVGKYVSADELKHLMNVPCKIKAGVFILLHGRVCLLDHQSGRIQNNQVQHNYTNSQQLYSGT